LSIQILKLISGETIATEVVETGDHVVKVLNPIEIRTESYGRTKATMVAYQWLPLVEKENIMFIQERHILGMAFAGEDMCEYYNNVVKEMLSPQKRTVKDTDEEKEFYEKLLEIARNANTNNITVH